MRASTHQLIIDLTNSTSTRQPGLLFDPVFSVRKSPCVLRGSVAPLCSTRPRSLAGRLDLQEVFDRRYMPVKWSHRIPPVGLFFFFFNRRNQRRTCEAALSCYDTISGTGGRWSMTGRAARGERERRRKEKTSSRPAATPHEHNQRLFYTLGSRVMGWEINKKLGGGGRVENRQKSIIISLESLFFLRMRLLLKPNPVHVTYPIFYITSYAMKYIVNI